MEIKFFAATDVGRQRDHNEDNYLIDPKLHLFVVADGMGGHAAGEVASQIAVHTVCRAVRDNADVIERHRDAPDSAAARQEILAVLEHAMQTATAEIFRHAQEDNEKRGMGTTCSALLLVGARGFIAHVGDSRIYLVRQSQVHQITEDHSLLNELIRRGKLKREEIETSPYAKYKNAVTRAVGAYETVEADTFDFEILPGDSFLMCSDGLHAYLKDSDIRQLVGSSAPEAAEAPKRFIQHANNGGGHDNITAIVVRIESPDPMVYASRAADLANKVTVLKGMPLFKHLAYKEIIRVLNLTTVIEFDPGEDIIAQGESGEELYVILNGRVRLHLRGSFITELGKGAHFGEMALVDRSPRSASATAVERTRVLCLRRSDFFNILRGDAPLAVKLLWSFTQVLTERLRKTTAELSTSRGELVSASASTVSPEDLATAASADTPEAEDGVVNFEQNMGGAEEGGNTPAA
jgi:serine/threonine protein phosphatase PrpC/CRP-like cAMP-binding protein